MEIGVERVGVGNHNVRIRPCRHAVHGTDESDPFTLNKQPVTGEYLGHLALEVQYDIQDECQADPSRDLVDVAPEDVGFSATPPVVSPQVVVQVLRRLQPAEPWRDQLRTPENPAAGCG